MNRISKSIENQSSVTELVDKLTRFTFYRGRVGLYAILRALGIGRDDKVAIQAYTCTAVPEAILAVGAQPLYIDVEPNGFNMDATDLRHKFNASVRAVVIQHTFGVPADLDPILEFTKESGVQVIEDCCHTFASTYDNRLVGTFGIGSFYSYEWGKPIVVGIGGSAIVDDSIFTILREQYQQFIEPPFLNSLKIQLQYGAFSLLYQPHLYWQVKKLFHLAAKLGLSEGNFSEVGSKTEKDYHYKLGKLLKKRLERKLRDWRQFVDCSKKVTDQYRILITGEHVSHPIVSSKKGVVYARYPLFVKSKRNLVTRARKLRVELSDWYISPIHPLQGTDLKKVCYEIGSCPQAELAAKRIVHLPTHGKVTECEIARTANFLMNK